MSWPPSLSTVTVHGAIEGPDGTAAAGTVEFRCPYALRVNADDVIVAPFSVVGTLVDGEFSVVLPVNDGADVSPSGWTYAVAVRTDVWRTDFAIEVPTAGGSPRELRDIAPVVTPPEVVTYALAAHDHDGDGHVEDVDPHGDRAYTDTVVAGRAVRLSTSALKTGAYTAAKNELVRCNAASGAFTVTLPAADTVGSVVIVRREEFGGNTITIQRAGSDTVGGGISVSITSVDGLALLSDGAGAWNITAYSQSITALDARYAAASHAHSGAAITSGTVPFVRLPVGTSSTTVSQGDHSHGSRLTVARTRHDTGNVTAPNTSGAWQLVAGTTVSLAAAVGDYLEFMATIMRSDTAAMFLDWVVVKAGAIARAKSSGTSTPSNEGDVSMYPQPNTFRTAGGPFEFVATSADIDGGLVTVQLAVKAGGAGTIYRTDAYPITQALKNFGALG